MLMKIGSITFLLLLLQVVFADVPIVSVNSDAVLSRHLIENGLPNATQTHEVLRVPDTNILLISQMSSSVLVKASINETGYIQSLSAFQISTNASGLHGLAVSTAYEGMVWITLENDNLLLLIDPQVDSVQSPPTIEREIQIPGDGFGPHYIGEYDDNLWVSLKESHHVLRLNHQDEEDYTLYPCLEHPIFVGRHPNGFFYASQDSSSSIMKIDPDTDTTSQIPIPAEVGSTPVGLIPGPNGIWFTLLGNATNGTGTIGFIDSESNLKFFKLTSELGKDASLLHLAFGADYATTNELWLLSSSITNPNALDMIIKTKFDSTWTTLLSDETVVLTSQHSKAHRILVTSTNVFATELSGSRLASYY